MFWYFEVYCNVIYTLFKCIHILGCCMLARRFTSLIVICSTLRSCIWVLGLFESKLVFACSSLIDLSVTRQAVCLHVKTSPRLFSVLSLSWFIMSVHSSHLCSSTSLHWRSLVILPELHDLTAAEAEGSHKVKMVIATQKQWKYLSLVESIQIHYWSFKNMNHTIQCIQIIFCWFHYQHTS